MYWFLFNFYVFWILSAILKGLIPPSKEEEDEEEKKKKKHEDSQEKERQREKVKFEVFLEYSIMVFRDTFYLRKSRCSVNET